MKRLKIVTTLLFALTSILIGCSKSDSNTSKSKTDLITQGSWKFSGATAAGYGDVSAVIPACYKDNVYSFSSNGSGSVDESTNVCAPSTAGAFTWSFMNNESTLHISTMLFQGGSSDFTLVSLSETTLVVSQTMTIAPYPSTTVQVTFKH